MLRFSLALKASRIFLGGQAARKVLGSRGRWALTRNLHKQKSAGSSQRGILAAGASKVLGSDFTAECTVKPAD